MDKIGIVILNYKSYHLTIDAIESLVKSRFDNDTQIEFYIVDNNSENGSLEMIEEAIKQNRFEDNHIFELIQSPANGGYSKGINQGIKKAVENNCDLVATVNPDILVDIDSLKILHKSMNDLDYAMLGPKIYDHDGHLDKTCARRMPTLGGYFFRLGFFQKLFPNNIFVRQHYIDIDDVQGKIIDADVVSGAFMLFNSDVLREIDYFDENTFLYNEEFIIAERLRRFGYKSGVNTGCTVTHLGGGSSQNVVTSKFLIDSASDSLDYYMRTYKDYPLLLRKIIILNKDLPFHAGIMFKKIFNRR